MLNTFKTFHYTGRLVMGLAIGCLLSAGFAPMNAAAEEGTRYPGHSYDTKEGKKRQKEIQKEKEKARKAELKAEKEAAKKKKKLEEKEAKAEAKKKKELEKLAKKNGGKIPSSAPEAPTRTTKTGEAINDTIVIFEGAYSGAAANFDVEPTVRHDHKACQKVAAALEKSSRKLVTVHENRLRLYGNDFHHDLELLAINAHRLHVASLEHHRTNIFKYWTQLVLIRDRVAVNLIWAPKEKTWER